MKTFYDLAQQKPQSIGGYKIIGNKLIKMFQEEKKLKHKKVTRDVLTRSLIKWNYCEFF